MGTAVEIERTETRSATCSRDGCGQSFLYTATLLGEKEFFRPRWCPACVEADIELRRRADTRQSAFEQRLKTEDQQTGLRRLLGEIGANAHEHGSSTLESFEIGETTYKPVNDARAFLAAVAAAGPFDPVRGLYYYGDTGTGKTHLAVGIIRSLILEADYPAAKIVFDHASELMLRIQDTYGRKERSTFEVLEKRFEAGLWILDDLGTERASDDVARHLTTIFTRRALRPTLITSNFSPDRLEKERPELMRVLSRLGPKYFRVCAVAGRDRRFDNPVTL